MNKSEELDAIIGKEFKVLDHGFIRVVDYMGNDSSITQAARVSYGEGTKSVSSDRGLIRYLVKHEHGSPLEMVDIKFHIKLPIFVQRQLIRHRISSINEYSGRYSIMSADHYTPDISDICKQSKINNQGRGDSLSETEAYQVKSVIDDTSDSCRQAYETLINQYDVSKEVSRMVLPVNGYTEIYWKINLRSLFNFLKLRMDSHAQLEIREYANVIYDIAKKWVPLSMEAFDDYILNSYKLSSMEIEILKQKLKGNDITQEESNLSKREWDAFMNSPLFK